MQFVRNCGEGPMKSKNLIAASLLVTSVTLSDLPQAQPLDIQTEAHALLQLVQFSGHLQRQRLLRKKQPDSIREQVRLRLIRDITLND
jgi:hypothetical protein